MKKIGVNDYQCVKGETIEIKFFCNPDRKNVDIRTSFDGTVFTSTPNNSVQLVMGNQPIILSIQYFFLLKGACLNIVRFVEDNPNNEDRVTARANSGKTDMKTFKFSL